MPGLPARAWYEDEAWLSPLAAAASVVAEELAERQGRAASRPYVPAHMPGEDWSRLRGSEDWSALPIYEGGRPVGDFPRTAAVMEALPLVRLDGVPIEAFFSRLAPGAQIPLHRGLSNARLTVHLPLVVPDRGARLRVGPHEHSLVRGAPYAFDDSWEHEARNDDPVGERVVLILEAWRPELTEAERAATEASYLARHRWLEGRRPPTA